MRSRDRVGAISDALVQSGVTRLIDRSTYRVVRTEARPNYHFGNYLVLDQSPAVRDLEHWFEKCRFELADLPVERLILQWETDPAQHWGGIAEIGDDLHYGVDVVLALDAPPALAAVPAGIELRELVDEDWEAVIELCRELSSDLAVPGYIGFARWRYGEFRAAAEAGRCRWWGAFDRGGDGHPLVASLGLFEGPELLRFQEVQTHPAYRRRGICTALCTHALGRAFAAYPEAQAIIVANEGSPAERIYRRVGFGPVGLQHNLQRDP